jgi:hypothetical protein
MVAPTSLGEVPSLLPRIETFISAACGGPTPCPSPERARWLAALDKVLARRMPSLPANDRSRLAHVIYDEAHAASLDPVFILAVIAVESGFDHVAKSQRGALGLMQLRPSTLRREAKRSRLDGDLDDPVLNVQAGVRYYTRLIRAFGSTDLALMAYNAGPNRILKYLDEKGGIPARFRVYPRRVKSELARLRLHLPKLRLGPPGSAPEAIELGWQSSPAGARRLQLGWQAEREAVAARPD